MRSPLRSTRPRSVVLCGRPQVDDKLELDRPFDGAASQNWYSRAGLSTRILLRIAGSGAQVGRRLSTRPSSTCHSGVTLVVLPFTAFGCGQLVPHRIRSTL